ncbi:non-canonical purine NTP pyrophosphatase, RdgB/HAM1 family [Boudabousia liubingyangii]|uniref:RdgB/HAM1 family non-canonical purine NTP pyrophosphatase n=1 Tax=Boudabousia liubingyangii TaxID=1921764 RepID=UPI00093F3B73|nr:RdgB/HAM1 family non-canonical purine NTP pyrophosphatase [Boudabousia liubingyangii]OKL46075.1 non-canonical purine NTP pyrophosphatase, RdgB/HAM1 family [Boudabousia liubingyangii]
MSTPELDPEVRLILATHNAHKVEELRAILTDAIPGFQPQWLASAAGLGMPEPVEDGVTFAQNALIKARAVVAATGLPAIADDSGICVDVLGGAPGIFSARWAGSHGNDQANLDLLLDQLSDIAPEHRGAAFVAAAALVLPDGTDYVELGEVRGQLLFARQGEGGFGYDPIFQPEGYEVSTAQLDPAEKNQISHRGRAFRALAPRLLPILPL